MNAVRNILHAVLLTVPPAAVAADDLQAIGRFAVDRTEVTIGAFARFVEATGTKTRAEREGGGHVYAAGWEQKPGWNWRAPYGAPGGPDEPAVHVTFKEAQTYCRWAGKRLPTDAEWVEAAYTERRAAPPPPFVRGKTYPYPTGDSPVGANCRGDCGGAHAGRAGALLARGEGHVPVRTTRAGVNGLFDMGANVWEWVDAGRGNERRTRGGSWWYGAAQMRADTIADKPADFTAVYIGFRCAKDLARR